jgi:fucokinase
MASLHMTPAGCWSDTPPITYEHGGAVVNMAVMIDGQKPIGAKARRIPELKLLLNLGTSNDNLGQVCVYVCVCVCVCGLFL